MKKIITAALIMGWFSCGNSAARPLFLTERINKANSLYKAGKYSEALSSYSKIVADFPESGVANFNMGVMLSLNRKYPDSSLFCSKAVKSFAKEPRLLSLADYNFGCVKYRLSEIIPADNIEALANIIVILKEAANCYKLSVRNNPDDLDAKYNYEFVLLKLKAAEDLLRKAEEERRKKEEELKKKEEEKEVETFIPIVAESRKVGGEKDGKVIEQKLFKLKVKGKPSLIPSSITVDVTPLKQIGDRIEVKDITAPGSVKVITPPETEVFSLESAEKKEKEQKEEDGELQDSRKDKEGKAAAETKEKDKEGASVEDKEILLDTYRELEEETRGGKEIIIPPFDASEPEKDW